MSAGPAELAAIAFPGIDPVALRLGTLAVHWYGIAYLVAFLAAGFTARTLARRWGLGLTDDDLSTVLIYAIAGVIIGGRLGYVLFYGLEYYVKHPGQIVAMWDGGMSFHGGLIGILTAGVLATRHLRMPLLTLYDIGAVGAPVGFGLGRIANFVNGELWGRPTDAPWGVVFPAADELARHPSQLYEAFLEGAVLFASMVLLARRLPPRPRGELVGWMLALYGCARIGAEFFREPDVQIGFLLGGVTMGQLLSLPMVICGLWLVVRARRLGLAQQGPRQDA